MISPFLEELIVSRQFEVDEGEIKFIRLRKFLVSPDLILKLQEKDSKYLYEVGKEIIKKELKFLKGKISLEGQVGINRIKEIYEVFGFGKIKILDLDRKKKRGVVAIHNSPIARSYLLNKKASKKPVCNFIAGKLAGMFSFILKKDINAKEIKCLAKGDDYCQFVLK